MLNKPVNNIEILREGNIIKQGDTKNVFRVQLQDEDRMPIDLAGASVEWSLLNRKGKIFTKTATVESDGVISFGFTEEDQTGSGKMRVEIKVEKDGTVEKFPADGWMTLDIKGSADDLDVAGVTVYTLQQFIDEVEVKKTELQTDYNAFVGNANTKIELAQTAADTANTAATNADTAASGANTAAGSANTAAGAANTAAANADEKADLTQQAVTDAGTATTAANDAAGRANTAAADVEDLMGVSNADVFQQISLTQPIDTRSTEIDRANGTVQAIRELDGTAVVRLTELGYGTDGQLAEVVQTAGGKRITTTLVRDADGIISGITKGVADVV